MFSFRNLRTIKAAKCCGGKVNGKIYTDTHICRRQYSYGRWIFWWLTVCGSVPSAYMRLTLHFNYLWIA